MKLKDIALGTRAVKRVKLPLVNVPSRLSEDPPELIAQRAKDHFDAEQAGTPPVPNEVLVGVRVLTGEELTAVHRAAMAYAKITEANDRNPIYNLAVSTYLCAAACVDVDSDPRDPDPFFGKRGDLESAALELFSSPHIGGDGITYLAEQQQNWQDACNPQALRVPPHKFVAALEELASSDEELSYRTFLDMRPGMRWRCMRSMAVQLRNSLMGKSPFGSSSPDTSSSGSVAQSGEAVS